MTVDFPIAASANLIGRPAVRLDGPAKVTGRALYASDEPVASPAQAFLLTSTIARGRVVRFDLDDAFAVPGVLDILTYENVGGEASPPPQQSGGETTTTMQDDRVWHDGQIIGVVVADTYEAAREAAYRVHVDYAAEPPSATFGSAGIDEERREPGEHEDFDTGDFDAAFAAAPIRIDASYGTPTQHHNPIELFTTTCAWNAGHLTIWEPSQFVHGLRASVGKQLGIDPERIHVVSKLVGGAFGSRGAATARTAWIAVAARRLGRPVKLVATRHQGFTIVTYRAETRHRVRLGASADGRLLALAHDGRELSSRPSHYNVSGTETTGRMYACPNVRTTVHVAHADRNTPGFMRAPPDTPYMFALESAMDELAHALGMDPIELRRVNDTAEDPVKHVPFTSRALMRCFDEGAERFGWSRRDPRPGAMTDGDWLVGWGCASAAYPANIGVASARVTLKRDGRARVQLAAHDIGTGTTTLVAIVAASALGLPLDAIGVELGDSNLPATALAAGSSHGSGVAHAVALACEQVRDRLARAAVGAEGPLAGRDPAMLRLAGASLVDERGTGEPLADAMSRVTGGVIEAYAENLPKGVPPEAMQKVYAGQPVLLRGTGRETETAYAFGAQFVEVRIHRLTREIRVPRMVGTFAAGTIVNPLTAHSQLVGGMIWGLGAALLEATEIDHRAARYVNDNLAEYLIAVNADVGVVDAAIVPEQDDRVNPLGMKGLGEIGIVGMNAAIANAVFHATGRRVRALPIRLEDLF